MQLKVQNRNLNTGGKMTTGVIDINSKFATGVNNSGVNTTGNQQRKQYDIVYTLKGQKRETVKIKRGIIYWVICIII
jgi:hypothetical protein